MEQLKYKVINLVLLGTLLGGCAQLQNQKSGRAGASLMVIASEECSGEVPGKAGSKGIIGVQVTYNHLKSGLMVQGKAFKTNAALEISPHAVLGEIARDRKTRRKEMKNISLTSLGGDVQVTLGHNPETAVSSGAAVFSKKSVKASVARGLMRAATSTGLFSDGSSVISLSPDSSLFYKADYNRVLANVAKIEIEQKPRTEEGTKPDETTTQGASMSDSIGFMSYRSININAPVIGQVTMNLPGDPRDSTKAEEYELGFNGEGEKDKSITIPIGADTNKPAQLESTALLIELKGQKDNKPWKATCVHADLSEGGSLILPMKGKNSNGKKVESLSGNFEVTVLRSYLRSYQILKPVKDSETEEDDGFIYVETRSGFSTLGSSPAEKK